MHTHTHILNQANEEKNYAMNIVILNVNCWLVYTLNADRVGLLHFFFYAYACCAHSQCLQLTQTEPNPN